MDLSDENFHQLFCKGLAVEWNGSCYSQQFSVQCCRSQDAILTVSTAPDAPHRVRIVLVHQTLDRREARVLGITDVQPKEGQFYFTGRFPQGRVYFVPVPVWSSTPKRKFPAVPARVQVHPPLLVHGEANITFTEEAEKAAEDLFTFLDLNNDLFLSKKEVGVLKECLGYPSDVSQEEWDEITYGWGEGDLVEPYGISPSFFNGFLLRLAEGSFQFLRDHPNLANLFDENRPSRTIQNIEQKLRKYFEAFGFDGELHPTRATSYGIDLRFRNGGIGNIVIQNRERVATAKALARLGCSLGCRWQIHDSNLEVSTYNTSDFCVITLFNFSDSPERVVVDCTRSVNAVAHIKGVDGYLWKDTVMPLTEQVTLYFSQARGTDEMCVHCEIIFTTTDGLETSRSRILP